MRPTPATEPPRATVDAAGAMELLGDNADLYLEVSQAFLAEIATLADHMAALLHQSDLGEASRVLHTFKGLSLTVGALALADACQLAEIRLQATQDAGQLGDALTLDSIQHDLAQTAAATALALQAVLAELAPLAAAPASEPFALDTAQLSQDLLTLKELLSRGDMRALDVHADLRKRHGKTAAQQLETLRAAIISFDFEQGVLQCSALIRQLRPPITRK